MEEESKQLATAGGATAPGAMVPMGDIQGSIFLSIQRFEFAQRVAKMLAMSTMVPDHFRDNVGNCMIALNLADRFQADPFQVMQNIYIVHGKPGLESKLAIALINQSGKFSPLQFKLSGQGDARQCTAYAKHLETEEVLEQTVSITMAKAEGWMSKPGSKWKTMPDLMLQYRSAMFFARIYCPEVLLGMQTKEELYDSGDIMTVQPTGNDGVYEPPKSAEELTNQVISEAMEEHENGTTATAAEEKAPEPTGTDREGPAEWERDQWIKMRVGDPQKLTGFFGYVVKNKDSWHKASDEIKQESRGKFVSLYGKEMAFPPEDVPADAENDGHSEPSYNAPPYTARNSEQFQNRGEDVPPPETDGQDSSANESGDSIATMSELQDLQDALAEVQFKDENMWATARVNAGVSSHIRDLTLEEAKRWYNELVHMGWAF